MSRLPHRFSFVAIAALSLYVSGSILPARTQSADTGTIAGHVTLTTRVPGARLPSNTYPTRSVGHHQAPAIPEIRNVVVYLKHVAFHGALTPVTAELKQENEAFVPHVVAVTRGSTVTFPNADPFFHDVFSLSSAAAFDLNRYPQGETRAYQVRKAGLVKVYCHIHSHMTATILVLDHPYFAIPDLDGSFELRNVAAGEQTIVGWHERVGERTLTVRVQAGTVTTVDISLPVRETP
jgi:plastocyanin